MDGTTTSELYELISHCYEAEFEYNRTTYVLQPEINNNKAYLVIWDYIPNTAKCIVKHEISAEGDIPQHVIDAVLSEKCFGGKSFMEIEQ